ncbi:hypothetical protein [Kaarinaea lacus]
MNRSIVNTTQYLVFIVLFSILLTGCFGAASIRPVSGPGSSAAFGNITLPGNKVITRVILYKVGEVYAPPFKSPPQSHTYNNGNFFFENLSPGKYYLASFMSGNRHFYFNFSGIDEKEFLEKVAIDIKAGSVNYLGSYEVTGITDNFFASDTFDIKASKKPGPKTILDHLIKATKGTGWDKRFANAI